MTGLLAGQNKKRPERRFITGCLAERAGFEPAVGYYPTHAFQACDLNHSSISPGGGILAEAFSITKRKRKKPDLSRPRRTPPRHVAITLHFRARQRKPKIPAIREASKMAIFDRLMISGCPTNARLVMKIDIVKPIPPRMPAPSI